MKTKIRLSVIHYNGEEADDILERMGYSGWRILHVHTARFSGEITYIDIIQP